MAQHSTPPAKSSSQRFRFIPGHSQLIQPIGTSSVIIYFYAAGHGAQAALHGLAYVKIRKDGWQ